MRFEVKYPSGAQHEVELQGTLAVLGRDPSCDLVLNDSKCSRRHAVLEAGPQGIAIRDSGSANGVFVNGRKIERASLQAGDLVRLGEVILKVLPEDMPGTIVMGPEDIVEVAPGDMTPARPSPPAPLPAAAVVPTVPAVAPVAPAGQTAHVPVPAPAVPRPQSAPPPSPAPPAAPPPASAPARPLPTRPAAARPAARPPARPSPPPRPAPAAPRPGSRTIADANARPLTVTVLAVLWMASMLVYLALGFGLAAFSLAGGSAALAAAAGVLMAGVAGLMAFGLWTLQPWARVAQLVVAGLGVFVCPWSLASFAILWYMLRSEVQVRFSERRNFRSFDADGGSREDDAAEPAFTLGILGALAMGLVITAAAAFAARQLMR